ncbi:MAG: 23S rRNA (adenine(2503)-C(2))-methyltransferase RlmN [Defluviitaleaceae bacterium]|nr:23S rRNA (adenine(2503)-C(2))-methyltransferase RlmN [Defluviitaleaceae bacterium]
MHPINPDILSLTLPELEAAMPQHPKFRAGQVFDWLHRRGAQSFADMNNLPKTLRDELSQAFYIPKVETVKKLKSKTDGTVKYLFRLGDGVLVESVLMEYSHGHSVCVSTQAGCKMGCTFCASGADFARDLTPGEILRQVYAAGQDCPRVGGVVIMGCGEPLDNFANTMRFIELATHPKGLNIGARHITLSTCGLIPQMQALAAHRLQITLAVSLHAPNDQTRQQLMPIAKTYPLKDLIKTCREYVNKTNRRITFEYALAKGINDSHTQAKELASLLKGLNCHVNLIPINQARGQFQPTPKKETTAFQETLTALGIQTTIRRSLGGDIEAACGQLRAGQQEMDNLNC